MEESSPSNNVEVVTDALAAITGVMLLAQWVAWNGPKWMSDMRGTLHFGAACATVTIIFFTLAIMAMRLKIDP